MNTNRLVQGKGINDYAGPVKINNKHIRAYKDWTNVLIRCYNERVLKKFPTYRGCSMSDDWLHFSKFKEWHDANYIEGYELDKDILVKGNRVYSAETCCYIPTHLNLMLSPHKRQRGDMPIGVTNKYADRDWKCYVAQIRVNDKQLYIGMYPTKEEAFYAYKQKKEQVIKDMATSLFADGKIDKRVYDALMRYTIDITD